MRRRLCIGMALAGLLCTACDNAPTDSPAEEVQQRLVGTWLREFAEDGVQVRRIMVLEAGGLFRETVRITAASGTVTEHRHEGSWLFDGTNLKRRYTSLDGEAPSAPQVPYATFAIRFPSKHEFIGTDHVRRREVRYARVEAGTAP